MADEGIQTQHLVWYACWSIPTISVSCAMHKFTVSSTVCMSSLQCQRAYLSRLLFAAMRFPRWYNCIRSRCTVMCILRLFRYLSIGRLHLCRQSDALKVMLWSETRIVPLTRERIHFLIIYQTLESKSIVQYRNNIDVYRFYYYHKIAKSLCLCCYAWA